MKINNLKIALVVSQIPRPSSRLDFAAGSEPSDATALVSDPQNAPQIDSSDRLMRDPLSGVRTLYVIINLAKMSQVNLIYFDGKKIYK